MTPDVPTTASERALELRQELPVCPTGCGGLRIVIASEATSAA